MVDEYLRKAIHFANQHIVWSTIFQRFPGCSQYDFAVFGRYFLLQTFEVEWTRLLAKSTGVSKLHRIARSYLDGIPSIRMAYIK